MIVTDRRLRRRLAALGVALVAAVPGACGDRAVPVPEVTPTVTPTVAPTATPTPISPDRTALVAIYNATDGPNWTNREYWLTDEPVSEWHGVTTDPDGRVIELALGGNGLSGALLAAFG
ncbi:MAG: hypothetical protein OXG11_09730, partial [Chloroflexi bacterium]|nr:hypothetical protein [Chloroflexota bacterium]